MTTEGLKSADVLKVRIPDTSVKLQKDDILIKGVCDIEINTVKDLAAYRYYKALTVNYNLLGGSPHIKVVGAYWQRKETLTSRHQEVRFLLLVERMVKLQQNWNGIPDLDHKNLDGLRRGSDS